MVEYPGFIESTDHWFRMDGVKRVLDQGDDGYVSIDFEFVGSTPTVLGLSAGLLPVSVGWSSSCHDTLRRLAKSNVRFAGHNVISADRPFVPYPVKWEDTLIRHWLVNSWFTTIPKGQDSDEGASPRGIGLLGLWSMAALYTDLPNWKYCRDGLKWNSSYVPPKHCHGACPVHQPLHYNALDALSVDIALPRLLQEYRDKNIPESLYDLTSNLMDLAAKMQERGVRVDRDRVRTLDAEWQEQRGKLFPKGMVDVACGVCARMKSGGPCKKCKERGRPRQVEEFLGDINPNSPKQIADWFRARGVYLEDTSKESILKVTEAGIEDETAQQMAEDLYAYKDEGKGIKSWFGDEYFHPDSLLHPRWNPCATSTGRWGCASPNMMNVPKMGKKAGVFGRAREVVVPRNEDEVLVGADYGQLEYRVVLWYAFVKTLEREMPEMGEDIFTEILPRFGNHFDRVAKILGLTPRGALKTVAYGSQYLEGIRGYSGLELGSSRTRKAIDVGALVVHEDWTLGNKVVGFTGVNLAKRLFGSASWENRAKALEIQELYFSGIPEVRQWHRTLSEAAERGWIQTHTGRYLHLAGTLEDRMKAAAAHCGQGGGFDIVAEGMVKYNNSGEIPYLMIHDELIFSRPRSEGEKRHRELLDVMAEPSRCFDGLRVPISPKKGDNWLAMEEF